MKNRTQSNSGILPFHHDHGRQVPLPAGTAGLVHQLPIVIHNSGRASIQIGGIVGAILQQDILYVLECGANAVTNLSPINNQHQDLTVFGLPDGGAGRDTPTAVAGGDHGLSIDNQKWL